MRCRLLHFTNAEAEHNIERVLAEIEAMCED